MEVPTALIATVEKADAIMRYLGSGALVRGSLMALSWAIGNRNSRSSATIPFKHNASQEKERSAAACEFPFYFLGRLARRWRIAYEVR